MKTFLLLLAILFSLQITFAQKNQSGQIYSSQKNENEFNSSTTESEWLTRAESFITKSEYNFKSLLALSFGCANRAQMVIYKIQTNGYSVEPVNFTGKEMGNPWKSSFTVNSVSKGNTPFKPASRPVYQMNEGLLVQHHHFFDVEYTNNENGLRQDFIINKKPAGSENLQVKITLTNANLCASLKDDQALEFKMNGKTILRYDALKVWDANKNPLNARMELINKNILEIIVDDENAVYPLTIDPLNHTAEWSGSTLGILPSIIGQTAIDAAYGYSVAGLGDVNGDGYADIAVGAPGLIDVISGTGTLASVGAVFVYYGSAGGLSVTPNAKLQSSTAVAGALFGYSIAAGDIDGDGKNDIIIGAPLDKITIIGGSGTVGKVYAFSGAKLTSTVVTPLLTLQLNGNSIIKAGINLSINALFGFSVAVTDDLNGDGKSDIIVGSPLYAGITTGLFGSVADVQSGAAFVFLSNGVNNYNFVKLNPP
ncbi:MAG TPA: integrin alpha, partial [Puia sp.]|nr:integrin alpha [Puia sp.]